MHTFTRMLVMLCMCVCAPTLHILDSILYQYKTQHVLKMYFSLRYSLIFDVLGSMQHNIKFMERTNKMQPRSRIYYSVS
jgi:hypothetical protein